MTMRYLAALCCAALSWGAPPQKIFPYAYSQEDLPNGLRLITVPTDFPNLVASYIVVQTGSRNEVERGKTGFAHLFEHIMFKGTEKFPPSLYDAILKKAGAAYNAFTTNDFTCYHATYSKEDLEQVLLMEADRFQHLTYSEAAFRTEALAVLGEYNKNSANPLSKLDEAMSDAAYQAHTYKHTTMGFLKDVQDMPNQYAYSKVFFDRYYRPEYTTIIVAGDVQPKAVRALVDKYWGAWKRGSYRPEIPVEPPQQQPRTARVDWPTPTLALLGMGYKGPAYSDTANDGAALDVLSALAFSRSSPLYRRLVVEEQKVDTLFGEQGDSLDPSLFEIAARIKNPADIAYVQDRILETIRGLQESPVDAARLDAVKRNLRYSFAMRMNSSAAIAGALARYVALRRTPETINRVYGLYAAMTPEDVQQAARRYLVESRRTTVTLTGAPAGGGR